MPRDFPFRGAKIVFIDNPADFHNLLSEIFGEDFPIGKNPTESDADFPIGKDDLAAECAECPVKDCDERLAAYEGADEPDGKMLRAIKDKAFRDAMRTEKLKLDIVEREAQLARQAMLGRGPDAILPDGSMVDVKTSMKIPKDHIMTPKFKVSFPLMEKPAAPEGEKYKVNLDLGKPFESLKERIDATLADVRKAEKKRKDAELDDLAERLFKKMSHQFYRDRGLRLSRINELLGQVDKLTSDLRNKEKVIGFYEEAVKNAGSIDWNKAADREAGHLVYVTDDEFETLKALKGGTAKVVPARATVVVDHEWVDFVDPVTGTLIVPLGGSKVEVQSQHRGGTLLQQLVRVESSHPAALRFTYRKGGVTVFFTSDNGVVTPFDFGVSKWRYLNSDASGSRQTPVPDDIPLGNMV